MLRRYTWQKAKAKLQHYRRRSPEASVLYQIVYHSRDDLQFQWEARFQHQYGCLRDEVLKTLDEYLNCGILAHGAARVYCDGCNHSLKIKVTLLLVPFHYHNSLLYFLRRCSIV